MSGTRGRLLCVVGGTLIGVVATALAAVRFVDGDIGLTSAAGGAVGGALCGFLVWALLSPRRRMRRAGIGLAALNGAAWLLFLTANPRIGDEGAAIVQQRAALDAHRRPAGMRAVDHPSTLLAGRTLTWIPLSEKPIGFLAGPAVLFVHELIVPGRYWQTGATVPESDGLAWAAFVLSTVWWVAAGTLAPELRRLKIRRADVAKA